MRPGLELALVGLLAATPLTAQRQLDPLQFERLDDTPESRARFPHFAQALDEAAAFNREFPDAVPSEVWFAQLGTDHSGFDLDILVAQLRGSANCGTLGCVTWVVGTDSQGTPRTLLTTYTHPAAPPELSRCGDASSVLVATGHGMELAWTEWRFVGETLQEHDLGPLTDPIESPPPCS